jgi:hypothetical protein
MDIDKYLKPEFDFSRLDQIELKSLRDVTIEDILYAFKNPRTETYPQPDFPIEENRWFAIGFDSQSRCFEMLVHLNDDIKYSFLTINPANEHGIRLLWCRRPKR